jgi:hypothetical protein
VKDEEKVVVIGLNGLRPPVTNNADHGYKKADDAFMTGH